MYVCSAPGAGSSDGAAAPVLDALAEGLGATLFLAGYKPTEHPYSAAVVRVLVDFAATSQRCAPIAVLLAILYVYHGAGRRDSSSRLCPLFPTMPQSLLCATLISL